MLLASKLGLMGQFNCGSGSGGWMVRYSFSSRGSRNERKNLIITTTTTSAAAAAATFRPGVDNFIIVDPSIR